MTEYWKYKFGQYLCTNCCCQAPNNDPTIEVCPECGVVMNKDKIGFAETFDNKCEYTEEMLQRIYDDAYIVKETCVQHEYYADMTTVFKSDDRYFKLVWISHKNPSANEFPNQPIEITESWRRKMDLEKICERYKIK